MTMIPAPICLEQPDPEYDRFLISGSEYDTLLDLVARYRNGLTWDKSSENLLRGISTPVRRLPPA